jgi:hypothetical protein
VDKSVPDKETQKKSERLHMLISPAELEAIDDWRFRNRIGTRADAIRRLAQMSLQIDEPIEKVYRRTKELYRVLMSRQDVTISLLDQSPIDWEKIAKVDIATSGELIKHVSELNMAVHAMTAQVLKMRGAGDIADLKAETDQIKADAAERTKMFRMLMKAADEGIELDDDEDEV